MRDLKHYVYGRYYDAVGTPLPATGGQVPLLGIRLEAGPADSTVRYDAAVQCVNQPELTG